jgi:hypothetical protein
MTAYVPPLEFGNRAFRGHTGADGSVIVIDSPREIDRSDVPIDPAHDIVVHGAYLAVAVGTQLLRRGFRGFLGVGAGIGRNESGIGALALADPVTVASLPTPKGQDFCNKGGKFGPHNLHENRPGSFQSEALIFATYHNAGVRVFDISTAREPKEVAHFIPPTPDRIVDIRPGAELVTQSTDVFVATDGTVYVTDTTGGLSILAYEN